MKVVEKEELVPAQTRIVRKYVAEDGKEFAWKQDCERYEQTLKIESHRVMKSRIDSQDLGTFDGIRATLYYIRDKDDAIFLANAMSWFEERILDVFQGEPCWIIYWYEDMGDYPGEIHIELLEDHINNLKAEVADWETSIRNKVIVKETEMDICP